MNMQQIIIPKNIYTKIITKIHSLTVMFFIVFSLLTNIAFASSAEEIDIKINGTIKHFKNKILGGSEFLQKANGVLIFPDVIKAGFVIGGEYGEGGLLIDGKTVDYYNIASASIGFQFGVQSKAIVLVFLSKKALTDFRINEGWKVGVDGSVALLEWGAGKNINSINIDDPIVGFILDNKGLMYNLTIEGSKFTKIIR